MGRNWGRILSILLCGALCLGALSDRATASPRAQEEDGPMVALTFDDGPYSPVTLRILDALESVGGRATFFVEGDRVAGCASVVRRANAIGCQIGIHTWDHRTMLTQLSDAEIRSQLDRCIRAVQDAAGITPTLVRPMGGVVSDAVLAAVDGPVVLWSVDPQDWSSQDADAVYDAVLSRVRDGDIVLLHDLYPSTAEAVERLVPALMARGYRLVTVEELAESRGYVLEEHRAYRCFA